MASSSKTDKPVRGILKTSKQETTEVKLKEAARFDEMNILATYHPADKDYGHMKIDEPKTPYRGDRDESDDGIDPDELAKRLTTVGSPKETRRPRTVSTDEEDDNEDHLTPEARDKKKKFNDARKKHYNMKEELKKARELLEKEMAEIEDD